MQYYRQLIFLFCLIIGLVSCEGTTFRSSVPAYPVRVVIDTRQGAFVHFKQETTSSFVIANRNGYFLDNKWVSASSATDAYGYGGVVVFVSFFGYDAYDLACPNCAEKGACHPCEINGGFAVCTTCEEQYNLLSGSAAPQKGIAREALRKLTLINSDGRLTVTQGQ